MKKVAAPVMLLFIMAFFGACSNTTKDTVTEEGKLRVTVTIDAIAEFAKAIGQDKIEVSGMIPGGTESHDFEPKAADIAKLSKSNIFIYNGIGMEAWAEDTIKAASNDALLVVEAAKGADLISNNYEEEIDKHGKYDPHIWLSIKGAETEVQNIADAFVQADPANKDYYTRNASNYIKQLEDIFKEYKDKFASLHNKNFVTGHAAFHYFCRDFGLNQNSVEDVFAEGEPSTKQLAELVEYCKSNKVTTIFAEELGNIQISKTLADEVGAEVETIYTMEGPEDELSYLERMRSNCEKVYNSLNK